MNKIVKKDDYFECNIDSVTCKKKQMHMMMLLHLFGHGQEEVNKHIPQYLKDLHSQQSSAPKKLFLRQRNEIMDTLKSIKIYIFYAIYLGNFLEFNSKAYASKKNGL